MDVNRVYLVESIQTKYDPVTSKNKTITKRINDEPMPCYITGMSNKQQLATFGNLTTADTVFRFINKSIANTHYIEIAGKANALYKVTSITEYPNNTVVHGLKVSEW